MKSSLPGSRFEWRGPESDVCKAAERLSLEVLRAYQAHPSLVLEHANIERATAQGGYGRRQLYELIQNGADALIGAPPGRIAIILTDTALYCANEGAPIDEIGVASLLLSHVSAKRGTEIGRFGLGFKSVLGITRHPEFYSRSGSFVFDAVETRRRILGSAPAAERFPVLRLAYPVDPSKAATEDPVLAQLFEWATTVVRLPGGAEAAPWLSADIANFPSEFLIFSPHVSALELDDRATGFWRRIELGRQDRRLELSEAGRVSEWQLFERLHHPSPAAREDAGELADRDSIPLMWAVQTRGRREDGKFWAFFPTEYRTTLSGILNAPWKTNEDRQNLLSGPFNEELIDVASELIADAIPELFEPNDPGHYLDLIPARGRESRNWADAQLTAAVYERMAQRVSLPDQAARLRFADEIHLHPEGIPAEALTIWSRSPFRPVDWVHMDADTRDRRSRVERLMSLRQRSASDVVPWLESLLSTGGDRAAACRDALRVAAHVRSNATPDLAAKVLSASIVLTADGRLLPPSADGLFSPGLYAPTTGVTVVDPRLAQDHEAFSALETLGVRRVDPGLELRTLASQDVSEWSDIDWDRFWVLARTVDTAEAAIIVRGARRRTTWRPAGPAHFFSTAATEIRVRTLSGRYRSLNQVLLPGPVVPDDGSRDPEITVDVRYHVHDRPLIEALGGADAPRAWDQAEAESWFDVFRRSVVAEYLVALDSRQSRPRDEYLAFESASTIGPLTPLQDLSEEGRALFTEAALQTGERSPWNLAHLTQPSYPRREVPDPLYWFIRREGRLRTSLGIRTIDQSVGPGLSAFKAALPVADIPAHQARLLGLPQGLPDLSPQQWEDGLAAVGRLDEDRAVGDFLAAAADHLVPPATIPCRRGAARVDAPTGEVSVAVDRHEFEALMADDLPGILVQTPRERERLLERWGLRSAAERVRRTVVAVPSGPANLLTDEYPGLRWHLADDAKVLRLQRCSTLRLEFLTESGRSHVPQDSLISGEMLYIADWLDEVEGLGVISEQLRLGLTTIDVEQVLDGRRQERRRDLLVRARGQTSDGARLLALIGAEAIRRELPRPLLDAVEDMHGELSDAQLGEVALAMFGTDVLRQFRSALQEQGLEVPVQWAGSRAAVQFVLELGFSREYAGLGSPVREPTVEVDGPLALPELHEFQRTIADRIRGLLKTDQGARRALLSLPTGAGKTRIAVQAVVEAICEDDFAGPLLWVADRDELCEQAVQSWIDVWRSVGPPERLHISRFWSSNETGPIEDGVHVIVATIQKLRGALDDPSYAWLPDVACLVVDEAHGSVGPEYTELLNRLGLGRSQRRDEAALLGLTATPFRGVSESETERLAARYGRRRLDVGILGANPEQTLQTMGVLAAVDHRLLPGEDIELTDEQMDDLRRLRRLPAAVEETLGASVKRNLILLDSLRGLPEDWPVLFFATSVAHAQTMAALLSLEGIPAAAVSSETAPGARRSYVERFRRRELRVLTNYGVLTQGFDAPAVRALYIARPTYSPNLYQQMIGRGLRGPLNGGKERCLVVNVEDNVRQFGERLAFHHFDYLWDSPDASNGLE